ncbi:hypothetical protein K437DRAFT_257651 [Tilletiaria anomala UBC 951]|uniref:Phosphoglycerate mutase-like protein n=1 Tax=Tilletiaria anomala (strain ATCC 24038 / CBS 436.72 / UBC 951) TaxID=1037660 RepID=A0A066VVZ7_TILAU|nr:uncharacterized protein K437DRAFT_257651 [Tilletiaria anomala UBC 951]KDN42984.1 hypothetical protein K437DRAFT_257651 [Tilletiaria anomala UBC 951]
MHPHTAGVLPSATSVFSLGLTPVALWDRLVGELFSLSASWLPRPEGGARRWSGSIAKVESHVIANADAAQAANEGDDVTQSQEHASGSGIVYLIRHAEKSSKSGNGLSAQGVRRAECLVDLFTFSFSPASLTDNATATAEETIQRGRKRKGSHRQERISISAVFAQSYNPSTGRRSRPYRTLLPLARAFGMSVDHACERNDAHCVRKKVATLLRQPQVQGGHGKGKGEDKNKGKNVLISWQHSALADVARAFGVHGLHYPPERFDIIFAIQDGRLLSVTSQECVGLDERYFGWRGHGRHLTPGAA